jgi:hypothetical protein
MLDGAHRKASVAHRVLPTMGSAGAGRADQVLATVWRAAACARSARSFCQP